MLPTVDLTDEFVEEFQRLQRELDQLKAPQGEADREAELRRQLDDAQRQLDASRQSLEKEQEMSQRLRAQLDSLNTEVANRDVSLREAERRLEDARLELRQALERVADAERRLSTVRAVAPPLEATPKTVNVANVGEDAGKLQAENKWLTQVLSSKESEMIELRNRVAKLERDCHSYQTKLLALQAKPR